MFGQTSVKGVANALIVAADTEREERGRRINEAWRRYEGEHPKMLRATKTDPNAKDNTSINLARKTVEIASFYTFGKSLDFEVTDNEVADDWLDECWTANRQNSFLLEMATSGGITGDVFLRVYAPLPGELYPRIVSLDAQTVEAEWDPVDINRVNEYRITFNHVDVKTRQSMVYRHRITRDGAFWNIIEEKSLGDANSFQLVSEERWRYAFCPIFHAKNLPNPHCFYGRSDIENDVLRINDAISFVVSNINRILRSHGHPQLAFTGVDGNDKIDRAIDNILKLPRPDSKIVATPYVTDLSAHFDQLQKLREAYHQLTSIPEIATGKLDSVGQLSGLALQILYGPLVQLVSVKRIFYGEMLVELCQGLLEIGKQGRMLPIELKWPQILPTDRKAEADTAISLQEVGVSKSTTLKELGYEPDDEAKLRHEETQAAQDAFNAGKTGLPNQPGQPGQQSGNNEGGGSSNDGGDSGGASGGANE